MKRAQTWVCKHEEAGVTLEWSGDSEEEFIDALEESLFDTWEHLESIGWRIVKAGEVK